MYKRKRLYFDYSTALIISPRPSGAVDMKKRRRKKKQNEENDWMLRMLMIKVRRRVIYSTRAICAMHLYFSRNTIRIRMAWAAVSLFARPWKLKVELKCISLRLIGVMFVWISLSSWDSGHQFAMDLFHSHFRCSLDSKHNLTDSCTINNADWL